MILEFDNLVKKLLFCDFSGFKYFQETAKREIFLCFCVSRNLKKQLFISFLLPVFPAFRKSKKTSLALYGGIAESEKNRCFNVIALCGVAPRLQFSANVYNSRGLYGVSKKCQRQKLSMLFLLSSEHVQKNTGGAMRRLPSIAERACF